MLSAPINNSPAVRQTNTLYVCENSLPKRDEQNALSQIVQETANNLIDVASMDTHNLDPQEYSDRVKLYSNRLSQMWNNIEHGNSESCLLQDISNPEEQLSSLPVSASDMKMVC